MVSDEADLICSEASTSSNHGVDVKTKRNAISCHADMQIFIFDKPKKQAYTNCKSKF